MQGSGPEDLRTCLPPARLPAQPLRPGDMAPILRSPGEQGKTVSPHFPPGGNTVTDVKLRQAPDCPLCAGGQGRQKERGDERPEAPKTDLKRHHLFQGALQDAHRQTVPPTLFAALHTGCPLKSASPWGSVTWIAVTGFPPLHWL